MERKNTGQLSLACTGNLRDNRQPRRLGSVLPSSNAIRLVREEKNTRLILHSLRPRLAPFKTDCEKKKLFCKLLRVIRPYFFADLRMEENKESLNRNRGPSPARVEK